MRILLVEDDKKMAQKLKSSLNNEGYAVELSYDGIDAEFLGKEELFDLIILDLGLPGRSGLEVLTNWRRNNIKTPVVILTARDNWHERVDGLNAGADDYLGKPFHVQELKARLDAVIRRHHGYADNVLSHHNLKLDLNTQQLSVGADQPVQLSGIEYRLIRLLLLNPQRICSKAEISDHIYEEDLQRDSNVVEVYVNRLRRRFGKEIIETHWGQGYKLGHQVG